MRVPHDTHSADVLGAYFDPYGSTYYRLALPVQAIGGAVAPFYDGVTVAQRDAASCIVLSRMSARADSDHDALRRLIADIRGGGRRMVIDLDDDYRRLRGPRRAASNYAALELVARSADHIVCTNATLARRLRDWSRDVRVLPNYVRPGDWPEPAPLADDGPPWVVLAGSDSHVDDWRIVAPALRRLAGRIRLRTVGYCPPYLADLVAEHVPWGPLAGYPRALAGATIGLCPLPRTPFNEAKSPIKAYEYALSGACVVASPCQYAPLGAFGAVIVPEHGNWHPALAHLIDHPAEAQDRAAALRAHVCTTLDVQRHVETIRAAYAA